MHTVPKITIAIAEDNHLLLNALVALLEQKGNTEILFTAENGNILLKKLEESQPKIILMDIRMPEMDGLQATQVIKEMYPDICVIILSVYDDSATVKYAIESGADGYLLKEMADVEELHNAIKQVAMGGTYF